MKQTMNKAQRDYLAAKNRLETLEEWQKQMERAYIAAHGITNPGGYTPERIYCMTDIIRHEELGGGYTMRPHVILDAADLRSIGKQYEVMALGHDGEELEAVTVADEAAAVAEFDKLVR